MSGLLLTNFRLLRVHLLVGPSFATICADLLYTLKVVSYAGGYIGFHFAVDLATVSASKFPSQLCRLFNYSIMSLLDQMFLASQPKLSGRIETGLLTLYTLV